MAINVITYNCSKGTKQKTLTHKGEIKNGYCEQ